MFLPLEQAALAHVATDRERTALFARYNLVGALAAALGALAAGLPQLMVDCGRRAARDPRCRSCSAATARSACSRPRSTAKLPADFAAAVSRSPTAPLDESRRIVYVLAALFSLDAFGGGFIVQSMLALWLFEKFQLSIALAATIFFWTGVLTAVSYLVAVRIAGRFGLINTMVFTHLPASCPAADHPDDARLVLGDRDAPCPQRGFADGRAHAKLVRHGGRLAARARRRGQHHLGPAEPGAVDQPAARGLPAAALALRLAARARRRFKIVYDLLLLGMFRAVRPPEESPPKP